eukprot:scaffold344_cov178-Ochromonas_danica.AAC.17
MGSLLLNLTVLSVRGNQLTGTLPSSLNRLLSLRVLDFYNNSLQGTFPSSILGLKKLKVLGLGSNQFNGSLPATLSRLPALTSLLLNDNDFSGTLPQIALRKLFNLTILTLDNNSFVGRLPPGLSTRLITWSMSNNHLSGSLPTDLSRYSQLTHFIVANNYLTGSLPARLTGANSSVPVYLEFEHNFFTGSLPASLGNLTIGHLFADENSFGGILPPIRSLAPNASISLSVNSLTGGFASWQSFDQLHGLHTLDLSSNDLGGDVPAGLLKIPTLVRLFLSDNDFGGPLPSEVSPSLHILDLSINDFHGTVPMNGESVSSLLTLDLSDNKLDGEIFVTGVPYGAFSLEFLDLSSNDLNGELGPYLSNMTSIVNLILRDNEFEGALEGRFRSLQDLEVIDLSSNAFTSAIPSDVFTLPEVRVIAFQQNCFGGSLPPNICDGSKNIETLAMNGLHAADKCHIPFFPVGIRSTVPTYTMRGGISGSVPSCLFTSYPRLQTLHMSSNSLKGKLEVHNITDSLIDLVLSHNYLYGHIPRIIQRRYWKKLDLSFNEFFGVIDHDIYYYPDKTRLMLNTNRLSGDIPEQLRDSDHISILSGNIFQCDSLGTQLPTSDPYYNSYTCGSANFDYALYVWVAATGFVLVFCVFIVWGKKVQISWTWVTHVYKEVKKTWRVFRCYTDQDSRSEGALDSRACNINHCGIVLYSLRKWTLRVAITIIVFIMPIYPVLTTKYGTYQHKYSWKVSLGYLAGFVPAVVCLVFFGTFVFAIFSDTCSFLPVNKNYLLKCMEHITCCDDSNGANFFSRLNSRLHTRNNSKNNSQASSRNNSAKLTPGKHARPFFGLTTMLGTQGGFPSSPFPGAVGGRSGGECGCAGGTATILSTPTQSVGGPSGAQPPSTPNSRWWNLFHPVQTVPDTREHFEMDSYLDGLEEDDDEDDLLDNTICCRWHWVSNRCQLLGVVLFNFFVVILVNMGYVYSLTTSLNSSVMKLFAISLSLFKLIWGVWITNIIMLVEDPLPDLPFPVAFPHHRVTVSAKGLTWLFFLNNLVVPCVSIALINPDCLYYIFKVPQEITSDYTYDTQAYVSDQMVTTPVTVHTSFIPPFSYSYQCSSALLVGFAEVFIYRFIFSGVAWPLIAILAKFGQEYTYLRYGEGSQLFRWLTTLLPPLIRPLKCLHQREHDVSVENNIMMAFWNETCVSWDEIIVFPPEERVASYTTDIAIIIAYGVIMPPIAVIGATSLIMTILFDQLCIGDLVTMSYEHPFLRPWVCQVDRECARFEILFQKIMPTLVWLLPVIWGFYLFDISGYTGTAVAIVVVMGAISVFIKGTSTLFKWGKMLANRWNKRLILRKVVPSPPPLPSPVSLSGFDRMTMSGGLHACLEEEEECEVGSDIEMHARCDTFMSGSAVQCDCSTNTPPVGITATPRERTRAFRLVHLHLSVLVF